MTLYGFATLREGHLPLWNPHQLCGMPFLAIPYVGLFYPPNLVYLFFNTGLAIEIACVLHMFFGAFSMWLLARHFGIGVGGALCSAVTFVWSGWLIYNVNQPSLFQGLTWMPLTVLALDCVVQGRRWAPLGLTLAVAFQILQGAGEIFLHAMYVGALFTAIRLVQMVWAGAWRRALTRSGLVGLCLVAGVLLSAVQILPTLELVRTSARAPGELSFDDVSAGALRLRALLDGALGDRRFRHVTVGFLPLLSLILVFGYKRQRVTWIAGLLAVLGAIALIPGGSVFRLYYALPFADVFRRPVKFLDVYTFALALLLGIAVGRLVEWSSLRRGGLWLRPTWVAALIGGAAVVWWHSTWSPAVNLCMLAILALLLLFGLLSSRRLRLGVVAVLCIVHGASLFMETGNLDKRPWQQPRFLQRYEGVLRFLRGLPSYERSYFFHGLRVRPGFIVKQATMNRINFASDYEPLVPARYGEFVKRVSGMTTLPAVRARLRTLRPRPFGGGYTLGPAAKWKLFDLTGTKYFIAFRDNLGDGFLASDGRFPGTPKFDRIYDKRVRVYERKGALPRAYLVGQARVIEDPRQVLAALESPQFEPRREVILEDLPAAATAAAEPRFARDQVTFTVYEPEKVVLDVRSRSAGFLVLTDVFYPGWKAFIDDDQARIHRANYLFRAVQVPAGRHEVRFVYEPESFRYGLMLSASTAAVIVLLTVGSVWRRRCRACAPL